MRVRMIAALILASATAAPATAQQSEDRGGLPTETMSRLANQQDNSLIWNLIGLIGLLGLAGMRRPHPDDGYHPAAFE